MEIPLLLWGIPAVFFAFVFTAMALWASLASFQIGSPIGGLVMGIFGIPAGIVAGGLWFLTIPLGILSSRKEDRRIERLGQEQEAKYAEGENYGKLMRITEAPEHLSEDYVGQLVTVIDWRAPYERVFVEPVSTDFNHGHRFYWKRARMEEV